MNECVFEKFDLRDRLQDDPAGVLAEQFTRHRARLSRIVQFRLRSMLAPRLDIDDVLQDAWLAALQRLPHFLKRESMSMFVWLRMIVSQTVIDLHRFHLGSEMRDVHREVSIPEPGSSGATSACIAAELLDGMASPSQTAMQQEFTNQLVAAIDSMDPIDREVLAMRHFEELCNSEVAEALQISEKAASIRYMRAVKRLKAALAVLLA